MPGYLINAYKILIEGVEKMEPGSAQWCPGPQKQQIKTETQEASSEHQRTLLFVVRVTEHWHRLPREVMEYSSLEDTLVSN